MDAFQPQDARLKHPFSMVVAGPSSCGKTVFVRRLMQHFDLLSTHTKPVRVLWVYGQWQEAYNEPIPNADVSYTRGLPSEADAANLDAIVIDDLMSELSNDKRLSGLFTRGSHHWGVSVVFIVQNLFHQGRQMRDVHTSTNYLVLFKNPRDRSQIEHLARQVYPRNRAFFMEAFEDATRNPYAYLVLDLTQTTPEHLRVRTRILPEETVKGEPSPVCYIPTKQ